MGILGIHTVLSWTISGTRTPHPARKLARLPALEIAVVSAVRLAGTAPRTKRFADDY